MDSRSELSKTDKMFTAENMDDIVTLFHEADADGGGGLDIEEFCEGLKQLFPTMDEEDLIALHMKIDTNGDGSVDLGELTDYLVNKNKASQNMAFKNQIFPKPIEMISVDHHKAIVRLIHRPFENDRKPDHGSEVLLGQTSTYQKGQYLSISSNGILNFWPDSFDTPYPVQLYKKENTLPFSHNKKMHVTDMVYISELKQLAISTSDRELIFYRCNEFPKLFSTSHSLIVEDNIVNTMNYWSKGTKAVFSFGDVKGFLSVFVSYNICENGLFFNGAYEKISLRDYPTVYVSTLLKNPSKDFLCVKVNIFNDICSQIQYFPSLRSFAICGSSSKTMVLASLPKTSTTKMSTTVFKSRGHVDFFTCVEYSTSSGYLLTGGTDALLRTWFPHKTVSCVQELKGHAKPITHIMLNPKEKVFVSLSLDHHICVWSEDALICLQSFKIKEMMQSPISSVCYNTHNNELVLANTDIGKYLGRGTDVFKNALTSHDKPLCCALYHNIFKQVVSVCQNGVVTVWDILTGTAAMQFKVTPDQYVGHVAISFDGLKRRLITISQDGKVKIWNFNNGTELAILPVTVQREVTGIVCVDNRVFVSGMNSKIIYDLDIHGYDNRFLKHDYLDDICSMDVHENTLVTASSNGNIVIWEAASGEVLYWLNGSNTPRTNMADKTTQGQTGSLLGHKSPKHVRGTGKRPLNSKSLNGNNTAVINTPLIICLKTREVKVHTATLLTSSDGNIYAWSVISKGGLIGKFRAVKDEGAVITTMSTDPNDQILLTGDSTGKIYQWDIQAFGFKKQANNEPFEDINGWCVSLCPPPLLHSWQSHITGVVSVHCNPTCEKLITAGNCNVCLWENTGTYIGLFGKDQWGASQISLEENAEQEETGRPSTTKTSNFPLARPVFPTKSKSEELTDSIKSLCDRIDKVVSPKKPGAKLTEDLLDRVNRRMMKIQSGLDLIKSEAQLQLEFKETHKPLENLYFSEVNKGSKTTSTPCPPNTRPTTGCTNDTISLANMQQSDGAVKQGTEPTSKQVHLQLTQSQFKPHPPLIRGGSAHDQLSYRTAYLDQTMSKYGRVLKLQQRNTLQGSVLTPVPPNTLPGMEGSQQKPDHVHLPPIKDKVHRPHHQTRSKFQQRDTLKGGVLTPVPPNTLPAMKTSPHMQLDPSRSKYGRVLKTQKRDTLQGSVFTQVPLNTLSGTKGSWQTPDHVHLPPILDKVQSSHPQTQIQQRDTFKGGVLTPVPPNTLPAMKTSSHMQLDQTRSKYGRVLKTQERDTLKGSVFTQVPPNTLSAMEGSQQTPDHVHMPPIDDKVHCPHHQTRSKFQQRDTLKGSFLPLCQPNTLPALKTLPHIQLSASTVKHGYKITSKYVPLPPISDKLTTDCTNATRSSSRLLRRGIKR
ncbi:WD repeat-containing protein on Y chromosome-like [Etheostoma spectabile]|uniref:WD repeat-containing protein on Y chromosome-like n=1 Tax=Etheostoma spectabile TaxID=54343 RepID=UPI0013AEF00C|nr:WD repeat-containing protein on Y chromosome-like [Etheostoma spectabile]